MPTLRELQAGFRDALLNGDEHAAAAAVRGDGLGAAARLAVYRHHIFTSLTTALESTYPVVVRLVDARFFRYAAGQYIREHPPVSPCLSEYGAELGDFLARFEPCRHLDYLPDVARLEWALNVAFYAPDADPIGAYALRPDSAVALHPSVSLLRSPWPIDAIWRANQPGASDELVDLGAGAVRLQIWRAGDDVMFRPLSNADFALRSAIADAGRLDAAAEASLAIDSDADLPTLVRALLGEHVLTRPTLPVQTSIRTVTELNDSAARVDL
jgi:hypothetical protein